MAELDKEKFGLFVAQLRKEQGLTQKELAERLYLSNKAVSKWERGLSLPDVTLLEPLAELLGVSVTELLRGERIRTETLKKDEVECLITAAAHLPREERDRRREEKRRWKRAFCFSALGSCLSVAMLLRLGVSSDEFLSSVMIVEILCLCFGAMSCFLIHDELPACYDRAKISFYAQGPFHMNFPGVSFNNRNWPHILRAMRWWTTVTPVVFPLFYWLLRAVVPRSWGQIWSIVPTLTACLGMFVPIVIAGKKYS